MSPASLSQSSAGPSCDLVVSQARKGAARSLRPLAPADEEGEAAARRLIGEAAALVGADAPATIVELLFGRTAPEDLLAYGASDLARLAQSAFAFLGERKPSTVKMRLYAPDHGGPLEDGNPKPFVFSKS